MLTNMIEMLAKAQKEHYAVGLFNATDSDMLEAVIGAAEELRSPVIIGTAQVLLPYGELKLIAPSMIAAAKRAHVPVAVHFDHGLTFERCIEALKLGFTSIMYDGSAGNEADNLRDTAEIVRICHAFGASVEGEIGHVGMAAAGDGEIRDMYTTPEEAIAFSEATGVDALAIAIGTAHGVYKAKPRLDIDRLKEIRAALDTPLVLHGGSGLSDNDFRNTIAAGITKVNIHTDLCLAGRAAMRAGIAEGLDYLALRQRKVDAIKAEVKKKLLLFGCTGKA